jgi:SAM-dependent methyltransferase
LPGSSSASDSRAIVRAGYDAIAERYAQWQVEGLPTFVWVPRLLDLLAKNSDVLEVGCGNGVPAGRLIAERHNYTGVDISAAQLELARVAVPRGAFVQADYTKFDPGRRVDAVVAVLTLTHVPREEHGDVLARFATWLRPGGLLLATFGTGDQPGWFENDWLGAPMFFSHFDADTNRRLVQEAGFELLEDEVVPMLEDGHGEVRFLWVIARLGSPR